MAQALSTFSIVLDQTNIVKHENCDPTHCWNKKKLCVSDSIARLNGDVEYINTEVNRMVRLAEDLISFGKKNKVQDLLSFKKDFQTYA